MKAYSRDSDNWRIVKSGSWVATYLDGGFWHLEHCGNLVAAWCNKHHVRSIINEGMEK